MQVLFYSKPVFELGQVVQTQGIYNACEESEEFSEEIGNAFYKYTCGNWGDACEEDKKLNDEAIEAGERIVAKYETSKGNVFIITEWDRSYTTILFADEY